MKKRQSQPRSRLAFSVLAACLCFGTSAGAQSLPPQNNQDRSVQDQDTRHQELANFDQFLDSHREIGEQLRRDPSLVNNREFVENHPALQAYLQDHPGVREEIRQNPNGFMEQEGRYDRAGDDRDTRHQELTSFDHFLDSHREIGEQLRRNPSLVNNHEFVENHPALQAYLRDNPGVRQAIDENPNAFMEQEARLDRRDDGMNRGTADRRSVDFGQFLGGHSNIAQQLSKNPSLVKNKEYLDNSPELQSYLHAHPDVREQTDAEP